MTRDAGRADRARRVLDADRRGADAWPSPSSWPCPLGMGGAAYIASTNGIILPRVPPEMRGRVLALQATAFLGSTPIGGPDHRLGRRPLRRGLVDRLRRPDRARLRRLRRAGRARPAGVGRRDGGGGRPAGGQRAVTPSGGAAMTGSRPRRAVVVWLRRDLRLADHPALSAAAADGAVVPLFVLDPRPHRQLGCRSAGLPPRAAWPRSTRRWVARWWSAPAIPTDVVPAVAAEVGARAVHATDDFGPYGRRRDAAVARALARRRPLAGAHRLALRRRPGDR